MCSYNAVNGLPTCGNPAMNKTLREDWGFEGYMTSDSDSCANIEQGHPDGNGGPPRPMNATQATKECLMGGTDIDSGHTYLGNIFDAVTDGEVDESYARTALRNTYKMRMLMGLFDPTKGTTCCIRGLVSSVTRVIGTLRPVVFLSMLHIVSRTA
eukprot:m.1410488 g.1410488  ORF g.1410488 m.1410488 type:complete len:155 (+) comp25024_c1_seq26:797-1261(+)